MYNKHPSHQQIKFFLQNSLYESLSSNSLPTSDSWNFSVDEIAWISLPSESFQQLLSRIFRQALVCVNISNVPVFSALKTFVLFGFHLPFRILSLRPERRCRTGFLRRRLLRTLACPSRPLREKGRAGRADPSAFLCPSGRIKVLGRRETAHMCPEAAQSDSETLRWGRQVCGRLELGLVGEGRPVKSRIPE